MYRNYVNIYTKTNLLTGTRNQSLKDLPETNYLNGQRKPMRPDNQFVKGSAVEATPVLVYNRLGGLLYGEVERL